MNPHPWRQWQAEPAEVLKKREPQEPEAQNPGVQPHAEVLKKHEPQESEAQNPEVQPHDEVLKKHVPQLPEAQNPEVQPHEPLGVKRKNEEDEVTTHVRKASFHACAALGILREQRQKAREEAEARGKKDLEDHAEMVILLNLVDEMSTTHGELLKDKGEPVRDSGERG